MDALDALEADSSVPSTPTTPTTPAPVSRSLLLHFNLPVLICNSLSQRRSEDRRRLKRKASQQFSERMSDISRLENLDLSPEPPAKLRMMSSQTTAQADAEISNDDLLSCADMSALTPGDELDIDLPACGLGGLLESEGSSPAVSDSLTNGNYHEASSGCNDFFSTLDEVHVHLISSFVTQGPFAYLSGCSGLTRALRCA